jgi:hypothetical protein
MMTDDTGAFDLIHHLGRSPTQHLRPFGVEEIEVVGDVMEGRPGTFVYLAVNPATWHEIAEAPALHYPLSVLGLFGVLDALLHDFVEHQRFNWTINEPLGLAMALMNQAARSDPLRSIDHRLAAAHHVVTELRRRDPRYFQVPPNDEVLRVHDEIEASRSNDPSAKLSKQDKDRVVATSATDDHLFHGVLAAHPWWDPTRQTRWLQTMVLPTLDPAELDARALEHATRVTRVGWRFPDIDMSAMVLDPPKHLAGETGIIGKLFV